MEHFKRYLSDFTPLNLNSGTVALDMLFTLSQPHLGRVESSLSGTVKVEDAEIATPEGTIVGRLRRGQAALKDFTLSERRIRLDEMELDGLYLRVSRDKAGRIDWVDWLSGTDANPENLSPETPFVVEGADLILRNSDSHGRRQPCGYAADRDHRRGTGHSGGTVKGTPEDGTPGVRIFGAAGPKARICMAMEQRPAGIEIDTGPYPGFPTDLQSVFLAAEAAEAGKAGSGRLCMRHGSRRRCGLQPLGPMYRSKKIQP